MLQEFYQNCGGYFIISDIFMNNTIRVTRNDMINSYKDCNYEFESLSVLQKTVY